MFLKSIGHLAVFHMALAALASPLFAARNDMEVVREKEIIPPPEASGA
jgi:hypothetical protein